MRRTIIGCVFLLCAAVSAEAVTVRDIIDLTKAGLGDEVMLALIEVDARVFSIDTETLTLLKQSGVSEKVIVALVRSGRVPPAAAEGNPAAIPPDPIVVYVDQPAPVVQQVAVPVPVYVTVPGDWRETRRQRLGPQTDSNSAQAQSAVGLPPTQNGPPHYLTDRPAPSKGEPVYWGFGGKLRPDAWKPK